MEILARKTVTLTLIRFCAISRCAIKAHDIDRWIDDCRRTAPRATLFMLLESRRFACTAIAFEQTPFVLRIFQRDRFRGGSVAAFWGIKRTRDVLHETKTANHERASKAPSITFRLEETMIYSGPGQKTWKSRDSRVHQLPHSQFPYTS